MSRNIKKIKSKTGLMILSFGAGIILAVLIPFWGWILAVGLGLIVGGWCLIQNSGYKW